MFSGKGSTIPKADPEGIGQERLKVKSIDISKHQASFSRLKLLMSISKLFEMDCIPVGIKHVNVLIIKD